MSVSLQMIVKDEVDAVVKLVDQALPYFDDIYLTVSDKTAKNKLSKVDYRGLADNVHVDWREWNDNFADARNHNWKLGENHDFSFWLDADDEFDFSVIPDLVALAEDKGFAAIYLPYNYAQDPEGRCIARHWRERLIRRSHPFEWRGAVHETLISDVPYKSFHVQNEIKHTSNRATESLARNHKILLKAASVENPDPRDLYYLGISHAGLAEYKESIEVLSRYIELSGWDEEIYRAFTNMSESAYHLNRPGQATEFAMKAMAMIPAYPQAYWLLAQYEADQNNYHEALEWVKVAETKPIPDSMAVIDPTCVGRSRLVGAQACFMLGRHVEALKWLKASDDPLAKDLMQEFTEMAETETFLKMLPQIRPFFKNNKALWEALDKELQYDPRARGLRESANPPHTWGDKSIVFFCGKGYEEWGPHTLEKGMGGSEEAIVYLSRELAKRGWEVDIFGEVEDLVVDGVEGAANVLYHPWKEFDTRDKFNVYVSWRSPQFATQIDAKVKICDVHDVLPKGLVKDLPDVTYFVKSQFHRNLYPDLPDEKFEIIGNGIVESQFNG